MLDSPNGDVRLSRTRSLRGHLAFSQVLPRRALARKENGRHVRENTLDLQNDKIDYTRRKMHRQVEHRLPTGAAWERTYEREIRKKETRKAAMAAVVAGANVTTACRRARRFTHRHRGVHRGPHERQPLPSGRYPPTGG